MTERSLKIVNATVSTIIVTAATDAGGIAIVAKPIDDDSSDDEGTCDGNCEGCSCQHDSDSEGETNYGPGEEFTRPLEPTQSIDVILNDDDIQEWDGQPGLKDFVDCKLSDFGYPVTLDETNDDGQIQLVIRINASV